MVCLRPVLRRLLSPGGSQIFLARPEGVPDKHRMLVTTPSIQHLLDPAPDRMGCRDLSGLFQDHGLEDNEPLRVPPSVPHLLNLGAEHTSEPAADLPTRHVIATNIHIQRISLKQYSNYNY